MLAAIEADPSLGFVSCDALVFGPGEQAGVDLEVAGGQLVALVGSGGTVEIAVRDGSAARLLGVGVGAEVRA